MKFDWKKVVRTAAPALGAALGGPMPALALKFMAETILGKPDATPAEAEEQLSAALASGDPDILLKLKQADHDFALRMKELGLEEFALKVDDTKSARTLFEINIWPQIILSGLFISGYFAVLFSLFGGDITIADNVKSEASIIIGVLTAGVVKIMDFWFGSSYGSKEKTALQFTRGPTNA